MAFGMILLVLVMLCSLAGSLIPQQESGMRYVNLYGPQAASLLLQAGLTDVFHTWYFYALEILLCVNLLLCSILRFPKTRKAAAALRERALSSPVEKELSKGSVQTLEGFLSARRFHREETGEGRLYSKNALGFYGSFFTHVSILLVLLFGSLVLMTPEISDQTVMPGGTLTLQDGTRVTCESFHIQDEGGRLDYASVLLAQSADGRESRRQEIRVNQPLRFGAYKIYQQTYGTAGRVKIENHENGAEETLFLTEPCFLSIDGRNGVYFQALYPGFFQDEAGNYTLITNTSGSYPDPVYSLSSISDGMSTSVLAFPNETLRLGSISFTFLSPAEYPGLRIKRVSTALYAGLYFSFGLMTAALFLCFFLVPVCVKVTDAGYTILSPKSQQGLTLEVEALLHEEEINV